MVDGAEHHRLLCVGHKDDVDCAHLLIMAKRGRGGEGGPEVGDKKKKKRQTQQNGSESQQQRLRDASSSPADAQTGAEGAACKKLPERTDKVAGAEKEEVRQAKGNGEKGAAGRKKSEKEDSGGGGGASCNSGRKRKKAHEEEGYEGPVEEEDSDGSDASEGMSVQACLCVPRQGICGYVLPVINIESRQSSETCSFAGVLCTKYFRMYACCTLQTQHHALGHHRRWQHGYGSVQPMLHVLACTRMLCERYLDVMLIDYAHVTGPVRRTTQCLTRWAESLRRHMKIKLSYPPPMTALHDCSERRG